MPVVSIGISGSYGGLNQGDEAILTAMVQSLRDRVPDVSLTVFSRNAAHTRRHHRVESVVPVRDLTRDEAYRHVEALDLLLLGGGGILYDGESRDYLREVQLAQAVGVPTMAYAIGAGPLTYQEDRGLVRGHLEQMDAVTVRDVGAKRVLEQAGVERPIEVTADPALLLRRERFPTDGLASEGVPVGRRLIGMSVRETGRAAPGLDGDDYLAVLANIADFMCERHDCDIVFIPMEAGDNRLSHAVMARMTRAARGHVLHRAYRPGQLLGLMEHFQLVIAMRLHVLMFAALAGTPLFSIACSDKVTQFLAMIGAPVPPPLMQESVGMVLAAVDRAWQPRLRGTSREPIDGLREQARRTVDIAVGCLRRDAPRVVAAGA
jgi:polysaccharide pyruvyl transferase CsaB